MLRASACRHTKWNDFAKILRRMASFQHSRLSVRLDNSSFRCLSNLHGTIGVRFSLSTGELFLKSNTETEKSKHKSHWREYHRPGASGWEIQTNKTDCYTPVLLIFLPFSADTLSVQSFKSQSLSSIIAFGLLTVRLHCLTSYKPEWETSFPSLGMLE